MNEAALKEWLSTLPECVQKLAAEFPPGKRLYWFGATAWVVGWHESDQLIVSRTDPSVDYDRAVATKEYICADHVRQISPDEVGARPA